MKEISADWETIAAILDESTIMHLALCDKAGPFCVPVNYARVGRSLVLHSGLKGRKADVFASDPRAGFSVVAGVKAVSAELACKWSYKFRSVRGSGKIVPITDEAERKAALSAIVVKFAGHEQPIDEKALRATAVWRLDVVEATARLKNQDQ